MREIKFRAWDKKGQMGMINNPILNVVLEDKRYIIMQFTGLKDKNGKEIFEGDILIDKYNQIWKIEFDRGCFIGFGGERELFHIFAMDEPKVIGNIYENLELMKEEVFGK